MNVIILSEFNLIKSTLTQAFKRFNCIDAILAINPMNVIGVLQEKHIRPLGLASLILLLLISIRRN